MTLEQAAVRFGWTDEQVAAERVRCDAVPCMSRRRVIWNGSPASHETRATT